MKKNTCINIKEINENLFAQRYFANCHECSFCDDACCSYGCPLDTSEMENILGYTTQLEAILGIPVSSWFEEITIDTNYPSGEIVMTRVYNGKCVFYEHRKRGCSLHRLCIEKGIDIHLLKPMVCCLFPVTWDKGFLLVSGFLDELPCRDKGISVFEAQKGELRIYLGNDFVTKLERRQDRCQSR